ncbi:MAG TPA: helix-hairpin-helix domain-containing protein [Tepidisphaeraceae bacterium]|jgi:DNA uptake protein ComE-like DNA-binding protein|nr:helix-hairpin-helix domain-containing protein [Tepidisphaeraceae bacterium]
MSLRDHLPIPWTASQRGVILVILAGLLIYGSIRFYLNRSYVSDPQPTTPAHAADLADRIDPNTADAPTLAVLPLIGEKRAADIVAYRKRYTDDHPGQPAFKSLEDLLKIRGIGASTIAQMQPFLIFPTSRPSSTQQ